MDYIQDATNKISFRHKIKYIIIFCAKFSNTIHLDRGNLVLCLMSGKLYWQTAGTLILAPRAKAEWASEDKDGKVPQ